MKENEPLITMVHTMIENSALRPQLYHQVRSWRVNEIALSSARTFPSDSFGCPSDFSMTLVFPSFALDTHKSSMLPAAPRCRGHGFAASLSFSIQCTPGVTSV